MKKVQTGLRVFVHIECETEDEIFAHLSVIRQQIKKQLKKTPEITEVMELSDENCYGEHTVSIEPAYEVNDLPY